MRKLRKLSLSRETLRVLQQTELRIFGGTNTGPFNCSVTDCSAVCFQNNGCATTGMTQCC